MNLDFGLFQFLWICISQVLQCNLCSVVSSFQFSDLGKSFYRRTKVKKVSDDENKNVISTVY